MNTDPELGDQREKDNLTQVVIGAATDVSRGLGFLERVHENALAHELRKRGLRVGTWILHDTPST